MRPMPPPARMRNLPYRAPTEGRDYWVVDDALAEPMAVRERLLDRQDWTWGHPYTAEVWPGMRAQPALLEDELAALDARVCALTGARKVWAQEGRDGARLNHNCVQVVGLAEGGVKPHTDSLDLCRYAAVLYLTPDAPARCGTAFYRQRQPDGRLGGNLVNKPHRNLVDALGTRHVPPGSFAEDVRIDNRFNRLLLYRANLIHSGAAYCGTTLADKRMTAVFFWMA